MNTQANTIEQKFELTHHGELIFTGTENECYFKLQRVQSSSADWAMKYEGYKIDVIKPVQYINIELAIKNNEVNFIKEKYIKVLNRWVLTSTETDKETEDFKTKFLAKDTLKWFRNLGGKESVKQGKFKGYGCTINTSISPDGQDKTVNYFFY